MQAGDGASCSICVTLPDFEAVSDGGICHEGGAGDQRYSLQDLWAQTPKPLTYRSGGNRRSGSMATRSTDCHAAESTRTGDFFRCRATKRYFLGWVAIIWSLILLYVALGRMPLETS